MDRFLRLLPLIVLAASIVAGASVGQQELAQLKSLHVGGMNELKETQKDLARTREDSARTSEAVKAVDERTKRIEDKLDRLLERR